MAEQVNGNGSASRLVWWLLSIFAALTTMGAGAALKTSFNHESRLSAVETQQPEVLRRLEKIENKLDAALAKK
jgi:hypothetical protein